MSELFRNVLNASFQGSIVIAAVLLLRMVLKKAPKKYICLLWILAGIRLLMPFSIESSLSLQPQQEIVTEVQWQELQDYGQILPEDAQMELPMEEAPALTPQTPAEQPENIPVPEVQPQMEAELEYELNWAAFFPWIWLTGVCGMLLYSIISYLLLKKQIREAVRNADGTWECSKIGTAFILGYVRPRIYLPTGLDGQQRQMILEHERCHLRRLDHWTKLVGFVVLAVHWFNPLVWLAYGMLCQEIEMACDEQVVAKMDLFQRKCYSQALLAFSARGHLACPVAFGEKPVKRRIKAVLNYRKPAFWLTLCAVVAIVFVAVSLLTSPKEEAADNDVIEEPTAVLQMPWKEMQIENLYRELERIQDNEQLTFTVSTTLENFDVLRGHEQTFWISGDDWYRVWQMDTKQGSYTEEYLQKDGKFYACRDADNIPRLGSMEWVQFGDGYTEEPPLLSRDWTACEVLEVRKEKSTDGGVVTVVVQGDMEQTPERTYYEHTHEFYLDEEGKLVGYAEYSFGDKYMNYLGTEGRYYIRSRSHLKFTEAKVGEVEAVIEKAAEEVKEVLGAE